MGPRDRLTLVAGGEEQLQPADLQAVLADHLIGLDRSAKTLAEHCDGLVEMMFSEDGGGADPAATLDMVTRLDRLRRNAVSDLQKTAGLLHHISIPRQPGITVIAAAQASVTSEDPSDRNAVDLGASRRARS